MINDTIISALTNLFALFCSKADVDSKLSEHMLSDYLGVHFGIRNKSDYIAMYADLRDMYSLIPPEAQDNTVDEICKGLKSKIRNEEGAMVLLRLMEFCAHTPQNFRSDDHIFTRSAQNLGIDDALCQIFGDFVLGHETNEVRLTKFDGFKAPVKTLWLEAQNIMVFSYDGEDTSDILFNDVPVVKGMYQVWDTSGVLKNRYGKPVYFSMVQNLYHEQSKEKMIEFSGRDINFRFPKSDNGMHDFSFDMHNGELIAIMGGSGAGKTTLVSILNGNIKPQSGTITINGHDISEPETKALIGFVPQDDLLIEELTVYQNLYYTAKMCFSGMTEKELDERVMRVLKDLGLDQAKDLKVGSPIKKYISGGQRKRLNIALELIREPAVLFLDEPTSGLSSSDTEKVILLLKEQTFKGRLVVTNIHQPSSDVYKLFDRLWLLDRGGYPIYDGNPIEAITYFKTAANYADPDTSTCPVCGNVNPEIVLNIIDEKALDGSGRQTEARKVEPQAWHKMYLDQRGEMKSPDIIDIPKTSQKKPGALKQFWIYLVRNFRTKITNLQYLLITLLEAPALAAICAILTHYAPPEGYSVMDNKNLVSYIFMAVIVAIFIGMSGSAEEIIKDRALLKREKFLSLSYGSYIASKIVFMGLVVLLQTLLFVSVGNLIMGLSDIFMTWWMILFVVAFLAGLTGLLLSQTLNSVVAIYITIPILLIPQILLCGLVVSFSDLTPKSTTGDVPLVGNLIPSRWAYEALAVSQFADNEYEQPLFELQREKYQNQYYLTSYLYETQSQLETMKSEMDQHKTVKPEHMDVIKKALPTVADICSMKPYSGNYDYASLRKYTDEAEDTLNNRCNVTSLREMNLIDRMVERMGNDAYRNHKRDHYNMQLENIVLSADSKHTHDVVDGYIVPRVGFIFLTPRNSQLGGAPFYSPVKVVLGHEIPTLQYNMGVLLFFCLIVCILLFCDFPGRYLRS